LKSGRPTTEPCGTTESDSEECEVIPEIRTSDDDDYDDDNDDQV
jgi:hypothetical protein